MAFKDLFDSDWRSKEDLRREIAARDEQIDNLRKSLFDLRDESAARRNATVQEAIRRERSNIESAKAVLEAEVRAQISKIERQSSVIINLRNQRNKLAQDLEIRNQENRELQERVQESQQALVVAEFANARIDLTDSITEPITLNTGVGAPDWKQDERASKAKPIKQKLGIPDTPSVASDVGQIAQPNHDVSSHEKAGPVIRLSEVRDTQEKGMRQPASGLDKSADKVQELRRMLDETQAQLGFMRKGISDEVWKLQAKLEQEQKRLSEKEFECRNLLLRLSKLENIEKTKAELEKECMRLRADSVTRVEHIKICNQLNLQLERERDSAKDMRYLLDKAEQKILEADEHIQMLNANVTKAHAANAPTAETSLSNPFSHPLVLSWLLQTSSPDSVDVKNGWVSLLGDGPWAEQLFTEEISERGFIFWQIPDSDIRHLIVGRKGWTEDALLSQMDSVKDEKIRIYSQEMFLSKLITGRDPFDDDDEELLYAFAHDHPALKFLIGLLHPWPEICIDVGDSVLKIDDDDLGVKASPLSLMGYHVGATSALSAKERRQILDDFFNRKILEFSLDSGEDYRKRWGRASSAQRLYRMAIHIKWLVDTQGKDTRKEIARDEWVDDLAWLRRKYYSKVRHRFSWP